jgi:hypothetical protein
MDFAKADFYSGLNEEAEYLGTIYRYGSPWHMPMMILLSSTKEEFKEGVSLYLENKELVPFLEWPHLWPDSLGTDYSYFFHEGRVYCSSMGGELFDPIEIIRGGVLTESYKGSKPRFPLMKQYSGS